MKTRLPYKQFSSIDFLSSTEKNKSNSLDEKIILKKSLGKRSRRWSVDHLHKNKYFSYIKPLSSPYREINNNPFTNIKKKRRKRSNSLVNLLYNINYKDIDNCNILWSQIYEKSKEDNLNKETSWTNLFRNLYDNRRYNLFNNYSPEIDLKISSDDDL